MIEKEYKKELVGWGIYIDFFNKEDTWKRGAAGCYYFYPISMTYYLPEKGYIIGPKREASAEEFAQYSAKQLKDLYKRLAIIELFPLYKLESI